jgi:hypothetical protein
MGHTRSYLYVLRATVVAYGPNIVYWTIVAVLCTYVAAVVLGGR